jgi:predicted nucleic acid-binding protein
MIVVSNTGPLLHLHEAKCLNLLKLTGDVHLPPTVATELSQLAPGFGLPPWITIDELSERFKKLAISWRQAGILDIGESEALSLAQQLGANWFLTDDAAARLLGNTLGIEVHGSLGVILWAAAVGHLEYSEAAQGLENLARSSLWLSPRIISEAQEALNVIFKRPTMR